MIRQILLVIFIGLLYIDNYFTFLFLLGFYVALECQKSFIEHVLD